MANIFEIVTYTVTQLKAAQAGRNKARAAVSTYPGFVAWRCFTAVSGQDTLVDVVEWESLEQALSAQETFLKDPEMTDFLAVFGKTKSMVHATELEDCQPGPGGR